FVSAVAPYFGPETARAFVEGWIYTPHFPQAVFVWEGDQVCEVLYPTPYPVRVPFRKRYVSGRESQSELDMGSPRQRDTSPEEILSVEVDPDTLTPYWGPRYSYPLSVRGRVGPNPFTQYLYINIAGLREVRLYDATGRLVGSSFPSSREVPLSWELPFLPAGVYWLWVEGDGGVRTFPLVREP
ncbi:MAG: T9SS type A sorting domain-containing protein, partial [Bacteroidia bacterium]|nr:T9SS type A sorting domain-containing protein [Bacteroidia bacterium]